MNEVKSKYFLEDHRDAMHQRIIAYLNQLEPPIDIELPGKQVQWLFPHRNVETRRCIEAFYSKYYSDKRQRILILGINPGRFGGGTTGYFLFKRKSQRLDELLRKYLKIFLSDFFPFYLDLGVPFTDPIRLKTFCQIESNFPEKPELSAQFIYDYFLENYSLEKFNQEFFIGAVCPLGLESKGRNMNYYDNKILMKNLLEHFIPEHIQEQIDLGCSTKVAICLGEGLNYSTMEKLNKKYHFFRTLLKLPHPRYIMQYKRKQVNDYVEKYVQTCQVAIELTEK